jgi:hypothetical protein
MPGLTKEILIEAEYFATNIDRMRYPAFREQGFFVGLGVIEAGCKSITGARLKRSGMFWTVRGAPTPSSRSAAAATTEGLRTTGSRLALHDHRPYHFYVSHPARASRAGVSYKPYSVYNQ